MFRAVLWGERRQGSCLWEGSDPWRRQPTTSPYGGRAALTDDCQTARGICKCTHLPVGAGGVHTWAEMRRGGEVISGTGWAQCVPAMGLEAQAEAKLRRPLWTRPSPAGNGYQWSWPSIPKVCRAQELQSKWRPTDQDTKLLNKMFFLPFLTSRPS